MARTPPFSGRGTPTHSVTRASETPHRDRANTNSTVARRNVLIPTLPGGAQNSLNEQRQRLLPEFPNVASNDSDQENNEGGAAVWCGTGNALLIATYRPTKPPNFGCLTTTRTENDSRKSKRSKSCFCKYICIYIYMLHLHYIEF